MIKHLVFDQNKQEYCSPLNFMGNLDKCLGCFNWDILLLTYRNLFNLIHRYSDETHNFIHFTVVTMGKEAISYTTC